MGNTIGGTGKTLKKRIRGQTELIHLQVCVQIIFFSSISADVLAGKTVTETLALVATVVSPNIIQENKMLSSKGNNSNVLLPYVLPYVTTLVTNNEGKQLVEVCIWLQSGL